MDATHTDTARTLARQAEAALDEGHTDLADALAAVARLYARLAATPGSPGPANPQADLAAAETRERAAQAELRAREAEDLAKLTPRERAARKVARMILDATPADDEPDPASLPLQAVQSAFDVSSSTASAYRTEAAALLAGGYRPAA
ncbi:hypothetical protein [Kitasatospora sp. NPDC015120]|uniref:hypothetical protein n=1 Tax=Kitasatospora sp. NPDC015120 TaxID=3364023 RepID=UPI0036F48886